MAVNHGVGGSSPLSDVFKMAIEDKTKSETNFQTSTRIVETPSGTTRGIPEGMSYKPKPSDDLGSGYLVNRATDESDKIRLNRNK